MARGQSIEGEIHGCVKDLLSKWSKRASKGVEVF